MSYSQYKEEEFILKHFAGVKGEFYDIGACEGKTFSNTRALLELGWTGVMVEPEPQSFLGLLKNTEEFKDRVTLVNAAIAPEESVHPFWESHGDAVSSLDETHMKKWSRHTPGMRKFFVHTLSVTRLFATFGACAFINLDVEGINWELFQRLPFGMEGLKMICVEFDDKPGQMIDLAEKHGFTEAFRNSVNLIFTR